jgi:hypothetical protein
MTQNLTDGREAGRTVLDAIALFHSRTTHSRPFLLALIILTLLVLTPPAIAAPSAQDPGVQSAAGSRVLMPLFQRGKSAPVPQGYHPDLNLAIRGYKVTSGHYGLVEIDGPTDGWAPQLAGLFGNRRVPAFVSLFQVYDWDWANNRRGLPLAEPHVTLAQLGTSAGETLHVPDSGYTLGQGFEVLVLYAEPGRLTLTYTRNDSVVHGYTLHIENIVVEPALVAFYRAMNTAGRREMPALRPGQVFGRAAGAKIGVAIRDCGQFMDPRSRKDWWTGFLAAQPSQAPDPAAGIFPDEP